MGQEDQESQSYTIVLLLDLVLSGFGGRKVREKERGLDGSLHGQSWE
jgi:hypothetical protein